MSNVTYFFLCPHILPTTSMATLIHSFIPFWTLTLRSRLVALFLYALSVHMHEWTKPIDIRKATDIWIVFSMSLYYFNILQAFSRVNYNSVYHHEISLSKSYIKHLCKVKSQDLSFQLLNSIEALKYIEIWSMQEPTGLPQNGPYWIDHNMWNGQK